MRYRLFTSVLIFCVLLTASRSLASEREVPGQYPTIQAAVNASGSGDTIIIAPGTYVENVILAANLTLRSIDPNDPAIVETTVIDANETDRVLDWEISQSGEFLNIDGLTLTGGVTQGNDSKGGALRSKAGTITIKNCRIIGNQAQVAGGIYSEQGKLTCTDTLFQQNMSHDTNSGSGGAIYTPAGELVLLRCLFIQNSSPFEGGAVATDNAPLTAKDCLFKLNTGQRGGGINVSHTTSVIDNCLFLENTATLNGGGIRVKELRHGDLSQYITHCTFAGNTAQNTGGAVMIKTKGTVVISNSIIWNNIAYSEGPQLALKEIYSAMTIRYSCVQGGVADVYTGDGQLNWLDGNIDANPYFADETNSDVHLKSTVGRWDPNTASWIIDAVQSPCIDAGDPNSDWTSEGFPHGSQINMGVYGGTTQGSLSTSLSGNLADIDRDGAVNSIDLELLSLQWLSQGFLLYEDLNRDGVVDFIDFALMAGNWGWAQ